jgi:predicted nucleic acid-binding Zn ribbon protein
MTRPGRRPRGGVDRGPRPVGESLDDVVAGLTPPRQRGRPTADGQDHPPTMSAEGGPTSAVVLGTLFSRWEELVGPAVARHARPIRLEGGSLIVAVDQPPWATQMRVLAPGILERLREETGERLDRLEVVVRPER